MKLLHRNMIRDQQIYLHYSLLGHKYLCSLCGKYPQGAVREDDLQVPCPIIRLIHAVVEGPACILHDLVP